MQLAVHSGETLQVQHTVGRTRDLSKQDHEVHNRVEHVSFGYVNSAVRDL